MSPGAPTGADKNRIPSHPNPAAGRALRLIIKPGTGKSRSLPLPGPRFGNGKPRPLLRDPAPQRHGIRPKTKPRSPSSRRGQRFAAAPQDHRRGTGHATRCLPRHRSDRFTGFQASRAFETRIILIHTLAGINSSQETQAGSEEEPRGHNVDRHKPTALQRCRARMLRFPPKPGTPVPPPVVAIPGAGRAARTRAPACKHTAVTQTPGGDPRRRCCCSEKTTLRGDAASTAAATQRRGAPSANGTLSTGMEMETQPGSKPARLVWVVGEESQPGASRNHPPEQKLATAGRGRGEQDLKGKEHNFHRETQIPYGIRGQVKAVPLGATGDSRSLMEDSHRGQPRSLTGGAAWGLPIGSAIGQVTPWGEEPLWGLL